MGSPEGEQGHQPDERLHRVRLSRDFFLSTHEVTERQWNAVVNPGTASAHPDWPMVNVSWFDVQNFIERLNASGEVYLSHTKVRGRYSIRLAVGHLRTERRHVERAWKLIRELAAAELRGNAGT